MAYVLTNYTGDELDLKLSQIDTIQAKLDTIEANANAYVLPMASRAILGGMRIVGATTTFPSDYGRINMNTTHGIAYVPLATTSIGGAMSSADKVKLDSIDTASYATQEWVKAQGYSTQTFGLTGTYYTGSGSVPSEPYAGVNAWNRNLYIPLATALTNGAMSADDKAKLDEIEDYAQENILESVKLNGNKLAISTKSVNIDLSDYATKDWTNSQGFAKQSLGITGTFYTGGGSSPQEEFASINAWNNSIYVPLASSASNGAMSSSDKEKLDEIDEYAQENSLERIKLNGSELPIADKAVNIDLSGYVSSSSYEYTQVKHSSDWVTSFIMAAGNTEHPFLQGSLDDDGYAIGHMLDGYTYTKDCKIPLISDTQQGLVDSYCYENYIQPLLNGEYDDNINKNAKRLDALEQSYITIKNDGTIADGTIITADGKNVTMKAGKVTKIQSSQSFILYNAVRPAHSESIVSLDVSHFSPEKPLTDMKNLFRKLSNVWRIDFTGWNTENVTDMSYLFYQDMNLRYLDVSMFDTSNVETMRNMFTACTHIEELNLYGWNTDKVTTLQGMFQGCFNLKYLNIGTFSLKAVTANLGVSGMFTNAEKVGTLILGKEFFNAPNVTAISLSSLINWNDDSVVTSLIINLYDRKTNGQGTLTITLSDATKSILTESQIEAITNKGYIIK